MRTHLMSLTCLIVLSSAAAYAQNFNPPVLFDAPAKPSIRGEVVDWINANVKADKTSFRQSLLKLADEKIAGGTDFLITMAGDMTRGGEPVELHVFNDSVFKFTLRTDMLRLRMTSAGEASSGKRHYSLGSIDHTVAQPQYVRHERTGEGELKVYGSVKVNSSRGADAENLYVRVTYRIGKSTTQSFIPLKAGLPRGDSTASYNFRIPADFAGPLGYYVDVVTMAANADPVAHSRPAASLVNVAGRGENVASRR